MIGFTLGSVFGLSLCPHLVSTSISFLFFSYLFHRFLLVIVDMVQEESATGESLETELIDGDDDVATVEGTGQVDNDPNRSGFARKRSTKEEVDDAVRKR